MRSCIARAKVSSEISDNRDQGSFVFCFPPSADIFRGHFPGSPILPGVFQVEMARMTAEEMVESVLRVAVVVRAKFMRPILPDEPILLRLEITPASYGTWAVDAVGTVNGDAAGRVSLVVTASDVFDKQECP